MRGIAFHGLLLALLLITGLAWAAAPTVTIQNPTSSQTVNSNQPPIQFTIVNAGSGVSDFNLSLSKGGAHPCTSDTTPLAVTKSGLSPNDSNVVSYVPPCNLSDATYTIKVGTTSAATPQEFAETSWNFTVVATTSSSAPANPRINTAAFTRDPTPKLLLKADGTEPWDGNYSYATSFTDFNILDQNFGCSVAEGLKEIWVQYAFTTGAFSDANKASTFYDVTKPTKPGNLTAALRDTDNAVSLKWDKSTDNSNADPKYNVYRSMDLNFAGKELMSSAQVNVAYADKKSLKDGTTYYYRITAVDSAGNESEPSDYKSIVAKVIVTGDTDEAPAEGPAISEKDIKISLVRADGKETLSVRKEKVTVKGVFGKKLNNVNLLVKIPGGKTLELIDASKPAESDNLDGFSKEIDMTAAASGNGSILFKAKDPANEQLLVLAVDFTVDTDDPAISWLTPEKEKATFAGKVLLKVKAADKGSGLDKVVFSYKELRTGATGEIGTSTKDDNGFFSQEWKFDNYYNGAYALTATVYDKAGNSGTVLLKETSISGGKNADKELTEQKLKEVEAKKADIDQFADGLKKKNVVSTKVTNARDDVEMKLGEAKTFQAAKNYTEAQKKLAAALAVITGLPNLVEVREAKKAEFAFDENALAAGLKQVGIDEKLAEKATVLIKESRATRSLEILEIKEGEGTSFQVNVVLRLQNTGADRRVDWKVLEVIPKDFIASAKDVRSLAEFKVLHEDPTLEFQAGLEKGAALEIVYSLNKALTKEEARAFIDAEPLKLFPAPPVVLLAGEETKDVRQVARIDLTPLLAVVGLVVLAVLAFLAYQKFGKGDGGGSAAGGIAGALQGIIGKAQGLLPKGGAKGIPKPKGGKMQRLDFLNEDEEEGVISFKESHGQRASGSGAGKRYEPIDFDEKPARKLNPLERLIEKDLNAPKPSFREPPARPPAEYLRKPEPPRRPEPQPSFEFDEPPSRPAVPRKKGGGKWGHGSE